MEELARSYAGLAQRATDALLACEDRARRTEGDIAEMRGSLARVEGMMERHLLDHAQPGNGHAWGRRTYDPDEEITEAGTRVKVPVEQFRRMQTSLANIERKERESALKEAGADELIKKWKGYITWGASIGIPAGLLTLAHWVWTILGHAK